MSGRLTEKDFKIEDYENFYEHHHFVAFPDADAVNINEFLPRASWALDVAQEIEPRSVLDLGCLEGFIVLTLANNVHSVKEGVGVDLSQEGVELGRNRAEKFELPVTFYQMALEDYLEQCIKEGKKFDLIIAFEVMEHVKDPQYVFKLIDQVKPKDGTVLISTPAFESPTYGKNDVLNKCHVRLYTMADEDYEEMTNHKVQHEPQKLRKATSLPKQIGKKRIKTMEVVNELINCRYQ